jgi:RNA polymerase sigma-70 factor (ECF subfamily)
VKEKKAEHIGLSRVMAAFNAPLLRYAARLLNNVTFAQDAVQNAWIKLSRREPPPKDPDDEIRNWLFRVVHNEAVDLIRAEERRKRLYESYTAEQDPFAPESALPNTGTDERETMVLACIPVLPPLQQQVVLLRLQQGLSYNEIAEIIGEKSTYVGNLLHHAIKALAAEVKRRDKGKHHV